MTKPFPDSELQEERQIVSDALRLSRMFASYIKLGEIIGPTTSLKQAANEAAAKLEEIRAEVVTVQAELDLKRAEIRKMEDDLSRVIADKTAESLALDQTLAAKQAEVERLSAARKQFLESVGLK